MTEIQPWFKEPKLPDLQLMTFVDRNEISDISASSKQKLTQLSLQALHKKLKIQGKLTDLEWLVLLNKEKEITELDPSEQTIIGNLVWKHIFEIPELFQKIMKKLMLDYEFGFDNFPDAFKKTLLRQVFKPAGEASKLQLSWVRQLILNDKMKSAVISLQHGLTPRLMVMKMQLNSEAKYINELTLLASEVLSKTPTTNEQQWWVDCQDEMKASNTVTMLEQLLGKLAVLESNGPLDKWLTRFYLPDSPHTEFHKLNEKARQQLLSLYNVTTYDEVEKIFKLLRDTSIDERLKPRDPNRLEKRIDFWSCYSNSFLKIRFLLTARSYNLLKNRMSIDTSRVIVMANESINNQTEICIFEFDNYIVIESFRGLFDMGIFEKSDALLDLLFSSEQIDAKILRGLKPQYCHDHWDYWQYHAREFFSRNLHIKPNDSSNLNKLRQPDVDGRLGRQKMLNTRYANGKTYFNFEH